MERSGCGATDAGRLRTAGEAYYREQVRMEIRSDGELGLGTLREEDAPVLFALVDRDRRHLREWLPWLDGTRIPEDSIRCMTGEAAEFNPELGRLHGDAMARGNIDHQGRRAGRCNSYYAHMERRGPVSAIDLFAGKAERYVRYRADYPREMIEAALAAVQLAKSDVVADMGSGTGMLARWILERGNRVLGVEPDAGMRAFAERRFAREARDFIGVQGVAEATNLPEFSIDVIVVGNAFHYFDPDRARAEAMRILRRPGRVLIVGHANAYEPNPFMQAYSRFLEGIADRETWTFHQPDRFESSLRAFFGDDSFGKVDALQTSHALSWDALSGRFQSTSLMPPEGDDRRPQVLAELQDVFEKFAADGTVEFQLRWRYAWGTVKS
jgi:SAM-dependent methyltransferase